ncbi:MAG: M67 family metallopeptidase [Thaumarchaeota archaeon]|jgi:proteasome lid subunit RPN8/RPN11|nr:M67 family metallopeptidase [Candidatus Geocrenenecus arthurdayi]MCL7389288.1 M67 family metallopeptidase [Candidatus Geocrenenecus arthurdayi]MCL7391045.1 M67 family metallopeptidase [Candidatus Geocrenenecus arthurdayi]MCL7396733.1 M67 family metallopeptidase [Candidatus Geocrenenecus arthurdayi]MCL7402488.1 M67 family metallopeptidase [Candidatus Geocrenenecus arthurdayi]
MVLKIKSEDLKKIINHCLEASPEECCGLLIGKKIQDEVIIERVKITKNIYPYDKRVGYVVDPLEYLEAEKEAEKEGLEVVGVYHSHIGLQPSPSMRDLEQAIPGYIYLIISVPYTPTFRAWIIEEEKKTFKEEKIEII